MLLKDSKGFYHSKIYANMMHTYQKNEINSVTPFWKIGLNELKKYYVWKKYFHKMRPLKGYKEAF